MPQFLHAADLHIDSPMRSLDVHGDGFADRLRNASRAALQRMVDCALSRRVTFVVIAGDMFDVAQPSVDATLHLVDQLKRLTDAGIRVLIVRGNHDFHARGSAKLWPRGVHEFSSERAESVVLDELRVAVHGRSYPEQHVRFDLTPGYAPPTPGYLNIGVLHTSLGGYGGEHPVYAEVSADTLAAKGYAYWALGHVHEFLDLPLSGTRIVYPGNLQGRHVREQGKKGVALVTYEGTSIVQVERAVCDVVRWHDVSVELSPGSLRDQLAQAAQRVAAQLSEDFADDVESAVRVRLAGLDAEGQSSAPSALRDRLREALRAECGARVMLEELRIEQVARIELPGALVEAVENARAQLLARSTTGAELAAFAKILWQKLDAVDPGFRADLAQRLAVSDAEDLRKRCLELGAQRLAVHLAEKV